MKPACLLVSLVLLIFLLVDAQGIRVEKEFQSVLVNQRIQEEKKSRLIEVLEENGAGVEDVILCKDGHCSSSGKSRKLLTKATSTSTTSSTTTTTTTTTKKNEKFGKNKVDTMSKKQYLNERLDNKKGKVSIESSSSISKHPEAVGPARYPDIIDIAGMDYTTARRKPPIHN